MEEIKNYQDINDFLSAIKMPPIRHADFYIVKFEDYKKNPNPNSTGPYTHNYFEISLSIGYDVDVSVVSNKTNAIDYNLVFVSPNQIVTWELNEVENNSNSYMMLFKPEFLPVANSVFSLYENFPFFNNNTISSYQLNTKQKQFILTYFEKINAEYKLDKVDSLEIIKAYLSLLLFHSKRELKFSDNISYLKSRAEEITFNFENTIKKTQRKKQSIGYYADKLNISSIYLSECVKKVTTKTAKQIINEYLILEAKSYLKQSSNSISEIAYLLGFEDNSNFVKYFKTQTKMTPTVYRKQ